MGHEPEIDDRSVGDCRGRERGGPSAPVEVARGKEREREDQDRGVFLGGQQQHRWRDEEPIAARDQA